MFDPILRNLRRLAEEYQMFPKGSHVLVACSGGGDSMCLLHALLSLQDSLEITLSAAHFNHQLRPEATEEAAFVQSWCAQRGIPCVTGSGNVRKQAADSGRGTEEVARDLRYGFLQRTAEAVGANRIATAHHARDNSETILLHLIRGSGLRGLGGIPPVRGNIVRPLLTAQPQEIQSYLAWHQIPFVEDASNADLTYTRNYLRHQVLPLLEGINPNLNRRLWESACQFRQEDAYLDDQAQALLTSLESTHEGVALPCTALTQAPEALALRGIQLLAQTAEPKLILSAAHRRSVLSLCRGSSPSGQVNLPLGVTARRSYDKLELAHTQREPATFAPVPLALPGVTEAAGWRFTCRKTICPDGKFNQPQHFYLALSEDTQVILRPRQTGDTIALPARPRKSAKKLLIDAKLPRHRRDRLPVLDCAGQVCALTGFGADQRFLPQPGQPAWQIIVEPIPNSIYAIDKEEKTS